MPGWSGRGTVRKPDWPQVLTDMASKELAVAPWRPIWNAGRLHGSARGGQNLCRDADPRAREEVQSFGVKGSGHVNSCMRDRTNLVTATSQAGSPATPEGSARATVQDRDRMARSRSERMAQDPTVNSGCVIGGSPKGVTCICDGHYTLQERFGRPLRSQEGYRRMRCIRACRHLMSRPRPQPRPRLRHAPEPERLRIGSGFVGLP